MKLGNFECTLEYSRHPEDCFILSAFDINDGRDLTDEELEKMNSLYGDEIYMAWDEARHELAWERYTMSMEE